MERLIRDELHLTPLESIDCLAALVPNSPLRAAATALAVAQSQAQPPICPGPAQFEATGVPSVGESTRAESAAVVVTEPPNTKPKRTTQYLWAVLIARICEVFPLQCPICGGQMRIIAFITHIADIRHILEHIGAEVEPPRITPALGPPHWDAASAQTGEGVEPAPDGEQECQAIPDFEVYLLISW